VRGHFGVAPLFFFKGVGFNFYIVGSPLPIRDQLENKKAERLCAACKSQIGCGGLQCIENCHLGRAFSLLARRRLGRMNVTDRLTKSLVDPKLPLVNPNALNWRHSSKTRLLVIGK
jgi:hypothetical protein